MRVLILYAVSALFRSACDKDVQTVLIVLKVSGLLGNKAFLTDERKRFSVSVMPMLNKVI